MSRPISALLLAAGIATVAWHGAARASDRPPAGRIVCIEAAGLAVRLLREEGSEGTSGAAGACPVPLLPAALPGEHLVSALLDDGSALELRRVPGEPPAAVIAAGEALERAGWIPTGASALLRERDPGAAVAEFESADGAARRAMIWVAGDGRDADPLLAVAVTGGGER